MSESIFVSASNQVDGTSSGELSHEWMQLVLFGAMAFLGWLLCSQAMDQLSQRFKPAKVIDSPKDSTTADYDEEEQEEKQKPLSALAHEEPTCEMPQEQEEAQEAVPKKKKKTKKAKKTADLSLDTKIIDEPKQEAPNEEALAMAAPEDEELFTGEIVCASDFEPRDGWITAGAKGPAKEKEEKNNLDECKIGKFDWYEASKDTEQVFPNKIKQKMPITAEGASAAKGKSDGKGFSKEKAKSAGKGKSSEKSKQDDLAATKLSLSSESKDHVQEATKMSTSAPKAAMPPPPSEAPSPAWSMEGLTWAEKMRLANPCADKEEPAMPAPKGRPVPQDEVASVERTQQKKKQRRQKDKAEVVASSAPIVVPPPTRQNTSAPAQQWDSSDDCPSIRMPVVVPIPPKKIPGVAPGWTWDTTEEFPHPDPQTGTMPQMVAPKSKAFQNKSMQLGVVINWGGKGFGFLGDQMGNRFYAKQEVVRGGGKLRIGGFVWFRLNDNNDGRVAEVANLEDHHEWVVKKAISNGTAWCRLRCEMDGDVTVLSEEEAGFPGNFHGNPQQEDLNWDVDFIQVANEAKSAILGEMEMTMPAVAMWHDSSYMAPPNEEFWPMYENVEAEATDEWTMIPLSQGANQEEWGYDEQAAHQDDWGYEEQSCQQYDGEPNLDAYLDEEA